MTSKSKSKSTSKQISKSTSNSISKSTPKSISKEKSPRKSTGRKQMRSTDDEIIAFWKKSIDSPLISVQRRFTAGYARVKRLRDAARAQINGDGEGTKSEDEQTRNGRNRVISKQKQSVSAFGELRECNGMNLKNAPNPRNSKKRKRGDSISSYHSSDGSDTVSPRKRHCASTSHSIDDEAAISALMEMNRPRTRKAQWIQKTKKALEFLKKDISAFFFLKPVDKELCAAYDYDLVIERPMDFETLTTNLNADKYSSISDFIVDVELIFINAKIYNPPGHSVHRAAENLQKVFKSNFQSVVGEYGDQETLNRWNYLDRPGGFAYGMQHFIDHHQKKKNLHS